MPVTDARLNRHYRAAPPGIYPEPMGWRRRGVTVLPMVNRPRTSCPVLMPRGRRLWAEQREQATITPAESGRSPGQGRVDQVPPAPSMQV